MKTTGANLIIKLDVEADETAGGIIIPDNAKAKLNTGMVIKVGREVKEVKEGDHVLINNFGGQNVQIEGESYLVNNEADVLVILEKGENK